MLVSHTHRFVFVKTRKTASTSLEIYLSQVCTEADTITPISSTDEIIRLDHGGTLPRLYSEDESMERRYRKAILSRNLNRIRRTAPPARSMKAWNHMSLSEIYHAYPVTREYRVISVDRCPYEKVVSMAYFRLRNNSMPSPDAVRQAIDTIIKSGKYRNIDLYAPTTAELPPYLIRYENLQSDALRVLRKLGVDPTGMQLPLTKSDYRHNLTPARDILTEHQKRIIRAHCDEEFSRLGYTE